MPRIKGKPIIDKGWMYWPKGKKSERELTHSVQTALEMAEVGFVVHRVQVRSVMDLTKSQK